MKFSEVKITSGGFKLDGKYYKHEKLRAFEGQKLIFRNGKVYVMATDAVYSVNSLCSPVELTAGRAQNK